MTPQELKSSILQLAIQGKLVEQRPEEGTGEELYQRIKAEKRALIKARQLKREKALAAIEEGEKPFDIPENWVWIRLSTTILLQSGADLPSDQYNTHQKGIPYITGASNFERDQLILNRWTERPANIAHRGDLLLTCKGTVGKTAILHENEAHIARQLMAITPVVINTAFLNYFIQSQVQSLKAKAKSMIPGIERENVLKLAFPLPPLAEQKRIVAKLEELLPYIERYETAWSKLENLNGRFPTDMQKSIIQMAIHGRLVEQHPEEGTAKELLRSALAHGNADGQPRKRINVINQNADQRAFDIPETWEWVRLGDICSIARGGSPRPIKNYITTDDDGINWIKISDTEKNGKYINSTAEKIRPSGVSKSRMVHSGDFLLTNSMSFGRPYILKTDGCIHDGWLVLSQTAEVFDQDYLYWLLSSSYAYAQFCGLVSGAVVKNLNRDKVANAVFPLPPLAEQKRIVAKLEEILPLCDKLK